MPSLTCTDCNARYVPGQFYLECPMGNSCKPGDRCAHTPADISAEIAKTPARQWRRIRRLQAVLALMAVTSDAH